MGAVAAGAQAAVERFDAIREPAEAGAARCVGAADAVVDDLDARVPVLPLDAHRHRRRLRVLRDVRQRLGDDEVRRRLDGWGQALLRHGGEVYRKRSPLGERLHRRAESAVGEDRRVDPARELAQLLERLRQLLVRPRE